MSDIEYSVITSDVIKGFDCICIHIDSVYVGIVTDHFSHSGTRDMALDLRKNFVSAQCIHIDMI